MQQESIETPENTDKNDENSIVPLDGQRKPRKSGKKGKVQIEEKRTEDGMQRKVVRDLGNGMKTVEITHVFNRQPSQAGIYFIKIEIFFFNQKAFLSILFKIYHYNIFIHNHNNFYLKTLLK